MGKKKEVVTIQFQSNTLEGPPSAAAAAAATTLSLLLRLAHTHTLYSRPDDDGSASWRRRVNASIEEEREGEKIYFREEPRAATRCFCSSAQHFVLIVLCCCCCYYCVSFLFFKEQQRLLRRKREEEDRCRFFPSPCSFLYFSLLQFFFFFFFFFSMSFLFISRCCWVVKRGDSAQQQQQQRDDDVVECTAKKKMETAQSGAEQSRAKRATGRTREGDGARVRRGTRKGNCFYPLRRRRRRRRRISFLLFLCRAEEGRLEGATYKIHYWRKELTRWRGGRIEGIRRVSYSHSFYCHPPTDVQCAQCCCCCCCCRCK